MHFIKLYQQLIIVKIQPPKLNFQAFLLSILSKTIVIIFF